VNDTRNDTRNDDTRNEAPGGRRRRLGGRAALLAVAAGLMLLTAACGGGSSSTSTGSTGSTGGTGSASTAAYSARLAFAQCVRAHGVAKYPDPDSSGQEPNNAKQIAHANPQFPAASKACAHLLPNGGQSTTSGQVATDQQNAAKFASCMRSHGVPNFPDATNDSQGEPSFNLTAAHIDPNSQQITSTAQECQSQLHLSRLPSIR
jgi:hypothetical protein